MTSCGSDPKVLQDWIGELLRRLPGLAIEIRERSEISSAARRVPMTIAELPTSSFPRIDVLLLGQTECFDRCRIDFGHGTAEFHAIRDLGQKSPANGQKAQDQRPNPEPFTNAIEERADSTEHAIADSRRLVCDQYTRDGLGPGSAAMRRPGFRPGRKLAIAWVTSGLANRYHVTRR